MNDMYKGIYNTIIGIELREKSSPDNFSIQTKSQQERILGQST